MNNVFKICISGLTGSGKSSVGRALATSLNFRHIDKFQTSTYKRLKDDLKYKDYTAELANNDYARAFDNEIYELSNQGNCVISTWLASWIIDDATLRVFLYAGLEERARRIANAKGMNFEEALSYTKEKDEKSIKFFKEFYNIDVAYNPDLFDISINTERLDVEEIADILRYIFEKKIKKA
ncbi:MAG: cytidylate kinase [Candidatus Micrarchaeota archaeon]|nr:MAG: cytidylate kinase [Candidatus Micrarchaeota archaeon]